MAAARGGRREVAVPLAWALFSVFTPGCCWRVLETSVKPLEVPDRGRLCDFVVVLMLREREI